jgi:L-cysteine:1D-myo-inositol 2-amino-2-deoxy-alpha-D-glucopyranoside ligase
VSYVQNVTDVDDPLLERATATGVDWRDLAASQIELFQTDMEALNVIAPDHYVGAVESMPLIVPEVERLVSLGLAYKVQGTNGEPDGDVYYDVEAAGKQSVSADAWTLGSISGLAESEMLELFAERGGDPGRSGKRQALDPLLWRVAGTASPAGPAAASGQGRPGWHIECTVIAQKYLPSPFTVQGGGSDLIFPHHEMGAGHAYSLAGVPLAKHYAHAGMVGLDGEKMSKSKGNLVLVSKLRAAGEDPAAIRLAILAHHYRSDWSWTAEGFERCEGGPGGMAPGAGQRPRRLRCGTHRGNARGPGGRPQRPRGGSGRHPLGSTGGPGRNTRQRRGSGIGAGRRRRPPRYPPLTEPSPTRSGLPPGRSGGGPMAARETAVRGGPGPAV